MQQSTDNSWQERTLLQLTSDKHACLAKAHVFVAGLGGVGAYAAEMLCRAGIGSLTIADADSVQPSNRNRQLLALSSTEGKRKVSLMSERLKDINPDVHIVPVDAYLRDEFTDELLSVKYDYVVDAIDTLSPKIFLIHRAVMNGLPLVSSMGAGGKMDPAGIRVADFSETFNCNLARILRKRLRRLGVSGGFKAVFSSESPNDDAVVPVENEPNKKNIIGTISYMPAIFGCYCASVVIRDLIA